MNPKSRRAWVLVAALLMGGLWWGRMRSTTTESLPLEDALGAAAALQVHQSGAAESLSPRTAEAAASPAPAIAAAASGRQRAFRMVLNGDAVELEAATELRGDFRPARRGAIWAPGRLCCRLLDAEQRVLAEDTVPAPDFTCTVLDGGDEATGGAPRLVRFTADGPVVFQVRLPEIPAARELRVYRLTGFVPPPAGAEPAGRLLASLALKP